MTDVSAFLIACRDQAAADSLEIEGIIDRNKDIRVQVAEWPRSTMKSGLLDRLDRSIIDLNKSLISEQRLQNEFEESAEVILGSDIPPPDPPDPGGGGDAEWEEIEW